MLACCKDLTLLSIIVMACTKPVRGSSIFLYSKLVHKRRLQPEDHNLATLKKSFMCILLQDAFRQQIPINVLAVGNILSVRVPRIPVTESSGLPWCDAPDLRAWFVWRNIRTYCNPFFHRNPENPRCVNPENPRCVCCNKQ